MSNSIFDSKNSIYDGIDLTKNSSIIKKIYEAIFPTNIS